jgi:hypothetical protein
MRASWLRRSWLVVACFSVMPSTGILVSDAFFRSCLLLRGTAHKREEFAHQSPWTILKRHAIHSKHRVSLLRLHDVRYNFEALSICHIVSICCCSSCPSKHTSTYTSLRGRFPFTKQHGRAIKILAGSLYVVFSCAEGSGLNRQNDTFGRW